MEQNQAQRFERHGFVWTPMDPKKGCPEDLRGIPGKGWMTLTASPENLPQIRTEPTSYFSYWGPNSAWSFIAYAIIGRDEVKASAPKKAKKDESKTFIRDGILWTRWDRSLGCPRELIGLKAGEWGFYRGTDGKIDGSDSMAYPVVTDTAPFDDDHWNPKVTAIVGYRVVKKTRKTLVAHGHVWLDCSEDRTCPAELKDTKGDDWAYIFANLPRPSTGAFKGAASSCYESDWAEGKFIAFRLIEKAPSSKSTATAEPEPVNPNLAMIERDGPELTAKQKHDKLVAEMVKNCKLFPDPKVEVHPLYRVSPISKTGTSLWGAEHNQE